MRHRCGRDCPVCERLAEEHADRQHESRREQDEASDRAAAEYESHWRD